MISKGASIFAGMFVLFAGLPAWARDDATPRERAGLDLSYATDADETEVVRTGFDFDWLYRGPDSYTGFRLERLRYAPSGGERDVDNRVYLRMADGRGQWKYQASVGTDGHTVVGNASIHTEGSVRQEYFVERDKIETPTGVERGLYYTFGGAAVDLPMGPKTQLTVLGGAQEFSGRNVRLHTRANFIRTLKSEWGLSAQLRTRYFRNSDPGEYDYYSPRWYAEALPVLQVRRFTGGWRLLAAGGVGVQRDSASHWRSSRYLNLRATSPAFAGGWGMTGDAVYTSTPITNSGEYHYLRANLGLTRVF